MPEIVTPIKLIYTDTQDFSLLTKIDMQKLDNSHYIDNSQEIKKMYKDGLITSALLPENNIKNVDELLEADNFSLSIINHDYAGITPKMWNFIAQEYGLNIKTSMVVIKTENLEKIFEVLRLNDKYI